MSWRNPPSRFAKQVKDDIDNQARTIATKILRNLIIESPRDEGTFVNNWVVALKKRSFYAGRGADKSGTDALSRGLSTIKQHKGGTPIFISNNLPYAARLNDGWSQQAPANFVQKIVARVS